MLLAHRVCIVTGAASRRGIGRATAQAMADEGARVAILDLDADASAEAAAEVAPPERALGLACDVTDETACARALETVAERFGGLDVLVSNAGITQPKSLMEIDRAGYDAVLDVSLRGTLNMAQAAVPFMRARGKGAIIAMSSVSAQRGGGIFGGPHYSAAKAGVLGLVKAMARELGPDGIRVNAVAPGLIDTDITAGQLNEAMRARILEGIPLGRLGSACDVAGVCVFLASGLASYVTGAVIDVNGGMHMH